MTLWRVAGIAARYSGQADKKVAKKPLLSIFDNMEKSDEATKGTIGFYLFYSQP